VRIRREDVTDPTQDGVVLEQDPEANATAPRGSEVAITVGEMAS
jgi:beta-lactam-binding protein with PASTA domain